MLITDIAAQSCVGRRSSWRFLSNSINALYFGRMLSPKRSGRTPGSVFHGPLERAPAPVPDELYDFVNGTLALLKGCNRHRSSVFAPPIDECPSHLPAEEIREVVRLAGCDRGRLLASQSGRRRNCREPFQASQGDVDVGRKCPRAFFGSGAKKGLLGLAVVVCGGGDFRIHDNVIYTGAVVLFRRVEADALAVSAAARSISETAVAMEDCNVAVCAAENFRAFATRSSRDRML